MNELLSTKVRQLLEQNEVSLVIGYGESLRKTNHGSPQAVISPIFVTKPEQADSLVWNERCVNNLATYLTRKEIKAHQKVAIMAKGCDVKAICVLLQENQVKRENLVIIGLTCRGVGNSQEYASKCYSCQLNTPHMYDILIPEVTNQQGKKRGNNGWQEKIDQLDKMSSLERWRFWKDQFSQCVRCYACRNVCPLCYCESCIADKSTPQWIEKSPLLPGNLSFHIMRAFHLTGRCINCGECERACPVNLPLSLLNRKMAQVVKDLYQFEPGLQVEEKPLFGSFQLEDEESFIK